MNIIDLCPVGALTSKDFRFESRVWFMDFTDSVCTSCARGCNVTIGARSGKFLRMSPRENPDVNRWWMCDAGRLGYKYVNAPTRVTVPRVRQGPSHWRDATWDEAISAAAQAIRAAVKGGVLADAGLTLEELWLLKELMGPLAGSLRYASRVGTDGDGFLITDEKGANQRGAEMLGYVRATAPEAALVLAVERGDAVPQALRDGAAAPIVFATDSRDVPPTAQVVFPLGSWAEKDGFVVNVDGIVQAVRRAGGVGPRDLVQAVDVLEEIRLEAHDDATPLGRDAVVDAIRALPAFDGVPFPPVRFGPPPAKSVAAPPGRTR
jgi:NADH-quinone oxidoreductase subunit G